MMSLKKVKAWLDIQRLYIVHFGMIAVTLGLMIRDIVIYDWQGATTLWWAAIILYMIRGYFWEETYRKQLWTCQEELDKLKNE